MQVLSIEGFRMRSAAQGRERDPDLFVLLENVVAAQFSPILAETDA